MALRLSVEVQGGVSLAAEMERDVALSMSSGAVTVMPSGVAYEGPYEVTPTLSGFDMETDGLYMVDDVTVNPIPISETSNPHGGYTVLIG